MKFLLTSLETLTNSKNCFIHHIKFLSFALNGRLFPCTFIAAFGTIFFIIRIIGRLRNNTGGYQKAGTSSLKRVTGSNSKISK
jgi:hypothetical protein